MSQSPPLRANRDDLARFVRALFVYSDSETYASLRAFDQFQKGVAAEFIRPIQINGSLDPLIDAAVRAAEDAANGGKPIVFAPPICTFTNPERARVADLANGLTLSVEIDDGDISSARRRLESILGPATVVVLSGSDWSDPHTGEIQPKAHLHWRLSEPTRDQSDHAKLRQARELATQLVGADPTGKPVVHPLRWPGSWNQKNAPGRISTIEALNQDAEVHLVEALDRLQEAIEAAGLASVGLDGERQSSAPTASTQRLASALAAIPNPTKEVHYDRWIAFGYACYRAAGPEHGYGLWDTWSQKSEKYQADEQQAAWRRIGRAINGSVAPVTAGAGTIFFHAKIAGWENGAEPPPDDTSDPGYVQSLEADWQAYQGGAVEHQLPPQEQRQKRRRDPETRLVPRYFNDIEANLDAADFVEGLLIEGGMSVIYGESNSGKTFFTSDLGIHVATGNRWWGREVETSGVIYCALEGAHGISNRIAAYREHHAVERDVFIPFAVIPTSINLLDPNADTQHLINLIQREAAFMSLPVRLVVIDTLSRALAGGNENASEDMGALVINSDRIRLETKAHVCFVHHCGKDTARGARGHSSLLAATDTEIEVVVDEGARSARVTKQREMECSGEFSFALKVVTLGTNRRGKEVTSCVVVPDGQEDAPKRRPRLSGHTKRAFDILTNLLASEGASGYKGAPDGMPSVPSEWWRDHFYKEAQAGADQDTKKRTFRRAADALVEMEVVGMAEQRVWIC